LVVPFVHKQTNKKNGVKKKAAFLLVTFEKAMHFYLCKCYLTPKLKAGALPLVDSLVGLPVQNKNDDFYILKRSIFLFIPFYSMS